MDEHLKLLAETGLALTDAEEALGAGEHHGAEHALDRADDQLAELRTRWRSMSDAERGIVSRAAAPLRQRVDAARARLSARPAVSEGAPEHEPEQDVDPAAKVA
jgi:hypothetical protein